MTLVKFLVMLMLVIAPLSAELPHPRLLLSSEDERLLEQRIESDALMKTIHGVVVKRAEAILDERACEYRIPDGKRLLTESRRAMANVLYCGLAWRTTDDPRFRQRVIRELDAAVALKDWNPSHFLDTAEMATAVALGYDWLFDTLTPEQRTRYEDALIDMGLKATRLEFGKNPWWFKSARNNWSQVCATGMALAADAVRHREPELTARVLKEAATMLEQCESFYAPDGAYPEGPGYWHYGTNYHVIGLAAFESIRTPIRKPAILERSGDFVIQLSGPTGLNFNFADGPATSRPPTPAQGWIARKFSNIGQTAIIRSQLAEGLDPSRKGTRWKKGPGQYFPLHLLWLPEEPTDSPPLALAESFSGEQAIAVARTGWKPDAAWFAIKGGTGAASHGHLDAGSFIHEAGGQRWFHDLGADNYNLPGYFYDKRWNYLRLTNHSHNILVIDGGLQDAPKVGCPIKGWESHEADRKATIDLTSAYRSQAKTVTRRATFGNEDGYVLLEDRIQQPSGPVRWAAVTSAEFEINGSELILKQGGETLIVTRHDRAGGEWQEFSLKPATSEENPNHGFKLLGFTAPPKDELVLQVSWKLE